MLVRLLPTTLFAVVLGAGLSACEGCSDDVAKIDDDDDELPIDPGEGEGEAPPEEARALVFEGQSPLTVYYGEQRELRFFLKTESGQPVGQQAVSFAQTGTGGALDVATVETNAAGLALVRFTAGTGDGLATITASAERADPVEVMIQVRENPTGTLVVAVSSQARIPVTRAESQVYAMPAAQVPGCTLLADANPPPTASFLADFTTVPSQRTFANVATGSAVTVKATGFSAAGIPVAGGCVEGAVIAGGRTTTVTVPLVQLPSVLAGDYDVLMQIDVGDALPSPYDDYLDTTTAILGDPAGYATYHALVQADQQMGTSFIWTDDGQGGEYLPTYEEVSENAGDYGTWALARQILDGMLAQQLGQAYVDVTTIGGDIRSAVTRFEVGARLAMTEGDADGVLAVDERWNDLVFTWRYGCPTGDMGCARRPVDLENTEYAPVVTSYGATWAHAPEAQTTERFLVTSDPHLFALKYGAVILIALNEVVFPSLPPGIAGNSLEEVVQNIVNCADVGVAVSDAVGFGSPGFYESFCDLGVSYVVDEIEQYALSLQVGGGSPDLAPKEQEGALGGGTLYLVDQDEDLVTELVRDFEYQVQWNDPANEGLSQDILAPITGEGRLSAAGCAVDAVCEAGQVCAPVPHYLKVQRVEMDCRRPVGAVAGGGACAQDGECASGLCLGASAGAPGACFSACVEDGDCGSGDVCALSADALDLDAVLNGLGAVSLSSCQAP